MRSLMACMPLPRFALLGFTSRLFMPNSPKIGLTMVRLRYRKPVVVITAENLNDPMVNMDFKERFRNHDHPIDLEHLHERFGSITRIDEN
eukprot:m.246942 g.246942  ORF g.246942 m.246942 type:complete len:90 (+) comp15858_c0_seq8:1615-1884(+)